MYPMLAFSSFIFDDSCENEHTFFKTQNPKTTPYPPLLDAHITGHEIIKKVGLCDLEKFRNFFLLSTSSALDFLDSTKN